MSFDRARFMADFERVNGGSTAQPVQTSTSKSAAFDRDQFIKDFERVNGKTQQATGQKYSAPAVVQPTVKTVKDIAQQQNYEQMQTLFNRSNKNDEKELNRINTEISAISGYGVGADRSNLEQLFREKDAIEQRLKVGRYDEELTPVERLQLTGQGIGESYSATPDVLIDTAVQAYKDHKKYKDVEEYQQTKAALDDVAKKLNVMQSKIDRGFGNQVDMSEYNRLLEQQAQLQGIIDSKYSTPLDMNTDGMQAMKRAMQAQQQATYGMGDTAAFLYNTGASIAENASLMPLAALPGGQGAILALMGAKSAAQRAAEVGENGGTAADALVRGLSSGLIEAATEKLPLDNLVKIAKGSTGKAIIKNILQQSGTEGTEEAVSYIANYIVDMAAQDPNAQFSIAELLMAFGGGAISGGVMSGGAEVIGRRNTTNAADTNVGTNSVENSAENAINSTENVAKPADIETADRKELEDEVKRIVGIDTRTEAEKVADTENERVALAEEMAAIAGAPQSDVERVRQSAEENIAEGKAKESLESAVELIRYAGKEEDIYSDSKDKAAAYNTAKRIGINLAHSGTTAMGRAVHEVGHDKTQSKQWQNYTAALDKVIATDGRLVKLMDDIDYAYRNSEDAEIRASVSFADGTIDNEKVRNEQYLKLTEIMLPNIAKDDKQLLDAIKKDRNVIDTLLDFIRGIKNKVSIKLTKSEAAMLDEAERQLVNLLRSEGNSNDIDFSLSLNAEKDVNDALNNLSRRDEIVLRDNTPEILLQHGAKNLKMVMKPAHVRTSILTEQEAINKNFPVGKDINYHGLGVDNFLKALDSLDNANEAYRGTEKAKMVERRKNYYAILTDVKDNEGYNILVSVFSNEPARQNTVMFTTNKFGTVFGHNNPYKYFAEQVKQGNLTKIKRKATNIAGSEDISDRDNDNLSSRNNVPQAAENSNGNNLSKNSGKVFSVAMDSDGNKLTEKQADYFKNSVARDSQGRLLTLYHQTNADFTEFNTKSTGAGRYDDAMPDGVFLKPTSADIGLKGKKQMSLYANITNPLQFRDRGEMARYWKRNIEGYADVQKQIEDTDTLYQGKYDAADLLEDEQYKKIRKQLINKEITAEQFRELLEETETKKILAEWTATSNDLRAKAKELINGYIADNDFDGIILENDTGSFGRNVKSYVVFNSNQVKNTDNTTPTKNADIRYSLQSDIDTNEYWGENSKSRAVERHAVNEFASAVADLLGVEFKDKNEILKKQAWKIADAAKKTGVFDTHQMIDFFENAYNIGKQETGNLDERNKQLKKELHNLGIKPLKGREYIDFVHKYQNKIRFSHKGTDIDIIYKELAENYPEWFSEDIVNPYDMMNRIGEVYDSIQGKKVSNKEFFGQDAEEFKSLAVQQYQNIVDNFIDTMNSVSRYQLALAEQKKQDETAAKKVYTIEDVKAARELAQPLMKEIARMDRKNLFTAEDRNRLNDLLKLTHPADIERMQESLRATNPLAEDIIAMYEKKKMLEAVKKPIYEYNKQRKARLKSQFLDILQTSDSWKDKGSGLAYMNNTFERNIDDIVTDKRAAEKLKDILPRQIHKHVADATRYKNKLRDKIRGFDIDTTKTYNIEVQAAGELLKGEATEADLIQMYGEGIVTKQYLDKIGANTKKIVETADKFREIYNELFEKINEAYVTNGYAPMEYRQDYFPHFFDETGDTLLNKVGQFLGFDAKNMLPTEIAGRTHEFSPGRQWNSHALQRKGEKTDYNVLKGFDNYIEAAANIIHLTEDIQNLRAFENAIRYKYSDEGMKAELDAIDALPISEAEKQEQRERILKTEGRNTRLNNFVVWEHEYTNLLAGKKSKADRWIEDMFGRRFYTVAKNIENRVSANMIAGNISSALTNFIPLTQLTAEVDGRYILTAMSDTIKNMKENDGIVDMSDFLTNRFGSEMLSLTTMQKLANKAGAPMALVDEFTSNVVTRARYLQNVDKGGMDSASAMKDADEYAASLMADRSKGALPTIFESKNPLIKLFTMFQVEQANQLNYLFKDLPRKKQEKAKGWMIWALIKLGVFSFLYNWLFEQISGRKPAFSPVDMVVDTGKDIKQVAKGEKKASAALSDSFVRTMENLPYASSVLAVTGLSEDAGRIPVSGALPDFSQLAYLIDREVSADKKKAVAMKELTKPALYLATPFAGGAAKKAVDTAVLYGKNKGVQYSIQSDGSRKAQFAVDKTAGNMLQSALFGKWSSKEAQAYIDNGFKGLTKKQTEAFDGLKETGMSNKDAWAAADWKAADTDGNGSLKTQEAKDYLDKMGLTREQKKILFSCMCPNVKNNPYE